MTNIVYGSELSKEMKSILADEIATVCKNRRKPSLAVILIGENPASLSYVRGKNKAVEAVGMEFKLFKYPQSIDKESIIEQIKDLNANPNIDGILVQLPLPPQLNEKEILNYIDPKKDVDGLHQVNVGKLYLNEEGFIPCTPLGIIELLKKMQVEIAGKHAVVIGRSNLVGLPVAKLLLNENATVTVCHSKTKNLKAITKTADILIVAVGIPKMITAEYVKKDSYIIDVGVNRVDNKLCGDCDFDNLLDSCTAITPVPKGVGPMTITMLLYNTFKAYKERELQ